MLQVPPISPVLILLSWEYLAEYKPWNFSWNFLQPCVNSSLLVPKLSLAPCSPTDSAHVLHLMWSTKFHDHTTCKITFLFVSVTVFLDSTQGEKKSLIWEDISILQI
jgi:hypothetical protein